MWHKFKAVVLGFRNSMQHNKMWTRKIRNKTSNLMISSAQTHEHWIQIWSKKYKQMSHVYEYTYILFLSPHKHTHTQYKDKHINIEVYFFLSSRKCNHLFLIFAILNAILMSDHCTQHAIRINDHKLPIQTIHAGTQRNRGEKKK